ncbi:hypothetical protein [Fusibacter sp. 3D3]|uniref:hypothetical protein n=1 Tax=Fusibacter sp. 3D3 TaxID=1048380 RepID=UPI000852CEEC|nr:hypothetical protein [Fusibacter sp. 3D3]GAU79497.1 hypothetical protein F3D3_4161 [Fusibacter sp. 3D3]
MITQNYNNHYIRLNEQSHIIKGFSDAFEIPLETDICICKEGVRHFELNGVVNLSLFDFNNVPKYKYVEGEILETTEEERQVYLSSSPQPDPTAQDIMATQITQLMLENAEKEDQLQTLANQVTELMLGGM